MGVLAQPTNAIPELTYCIFQCMFAAITPALAIGAACERGRMLPCIVFIFVWATVVYDPIACWTWNPHGWVAQMGGLDFAGGTVVHISSGSAALAYALMLERGGGIGRRRLSISLIMPLTSSLERCLCGLGGLVSMEVPPLALPFVPPWHASSLTFRHRSLG